MYRTRFAPSPTGLLHLGHAFSALTAQARAEAGGGTALLRIEDTDRARCRPEYEAAIYDDLAWLGFRWEGSVRRQSDHLADYQAALDRLIAMGLCYPCGCTRADIAAAAPQEGAAPGVYPGTCRHRTMDGYRPGEAIRLNLAKALAKAPGPLAFDETGAAHAGRHSVDPDRLIAETGDIVLSRKDIGPGAYHLAVVVDDALQGITDVVRGEDLFDASYLHVVLQALLDLSTPLYHHHRLIRDEAGKRLAKRDDARAIATYRAEGATPGDIRRMIGL